MGSIHPPAHKASSGGVLVCDPRDALLPDFSRACIWIFLEVVTDMQTCSHTPTSPVSLPGYIKLGKGQRFYPVTDRRWVNSGTSVDASSHASIVTVFKMFQC